VIAPGHHATPHEKGFSMTNVTPATPMSLRDACSAFVTHQRERGQKPSTIGTICRTLELLIAEMGEDKEVGKILTVHVDKFYKSESATMQPGKDGLKPRAKASVLQIRRIVRLALVWWNQQGWIDRLALPAEERKFVERQEQKRQAKQRNGQDQGQPEQPSDATPDAAQATDPTPAIDDRPAEEG